MKPVGQRRRPALTLAVVMSSLIVCTACPRPIAEKAWEEIRSQLETRLANMEASGWRAHFHPELIDRRGAVLGSFSLGSQDTHFDAMTCERKCVLLFIDTQPHHHFSHPTLIVLFDVSKWELVGIRRAEWWPTIDGRSVFHTVASRRNPEWIVAQDDNALPIPIAPPTIRYKLARLERPFPATQRRGAPPPGPPSGAPPPLPPGGTTATGTCAVLVNGYNDVSDTFDEDTVGMYRVLQGYGVPESRIRLLSPLDHTGDGINAIPVSVDALRQAMEDVGDQCDDLLLFFSTHGDASGNLACGIQADYQAQLSYEAAEYYMPRNDLKEMLDQSISDDASVTIVIEACNSGLALEYFSSYFRQGRDDSPWRMFVSAKGDTSSAGDIDTSDDLNVADSGSETIWGYVEAFGTLAADTDDNGWVDFKEAVEYAETNDVTPDHDGDCFPVLKDLSSVAVHSSQLDRWAGQPAISLESVCPSSDTDEMRPCDRVVTPGSPAWLSLTVENTANTQSTMPFTVRLFRPGPNADYKPHYHEEDEIRSTVMIPILDAGESVEVLVDLGEIPKSFNELDTIKIQAVADHLGQPPEDDQIASRTGIADLEGSQYQEQFTEGDTGSATAEIVLSINKE